MYVFTLFFLPQVPRVSKVRRWKLSDTFLEWNDKCPKIAVRFSWFECLLNLLDDFAPRPTHNLTLQAFDCRYSAPNTWDFRQWNVLYAEEKVAWSERSAGTCEQLCFEQWIERLSQFLGILL